MVNRETSGGSPRSRTPASPRPLGVDEAVLLMDDLPPQGRAEIARESDLDDQQSALSEEIASVRADIRAEIRGLKTWLLMWMVPTIIGSVGVAVTLSRLP